MAVIGITGSIASGKSTFRDLLAACLEADVFDADVTAKHYLNEDPATRDEVRRAFGPGVYPHDGPADRNELRRMIFADPRTRTHLEQILHPKVRSEWSALAAHPRYAAGEHLLVDIPLLFETNADAILKRVVTVACSQEIQLLRLRERGLDDETARRIVAAQMPRDEKMARSSHVVWNDGSLAALEQQARTLAGALLQ